MINIKANIEQVAEQIKTACSQCGRQASEVKLLAVSKTKPAHLVEHAYQAGQRDFGENYVQEGVEKIAELAHLPAICWHYIGPIQSNKTRQIAENFSWVHSVDRVKIATRLDQQRCGHDTPLNVCLQVNISEESTKSGATAEQIAELAQIVDQCQHLTLRGLMAIPEKDANDSTYQQMATLFIQLKQQYPQVDTLSMGMSDDLVPAITAGSTMVRIGTAIFGQRN